MAQSRTVLGVLRERVHARHYRPRTLQAYTYFVRRFLRCYRGRHPRDLDVRHVRDFLTHLAHDGRVRASTQNQALAAVTTARSVSITRGWVRRAQGDHRVGDGAVGTCAGLRVR